MQFVRGGGWLKDAMCITFSIGWCVLPLLVYNISRLAASNVGYLYIVQWTIYSSCRYLFTMSMSAYYL
ncbi:hypothetical protein GGI42DRAFT_332854 [Trichoderma sp. SZMC 28013]